MNPSAVIVLQPQFNQGLFLTLCKEMLGESPSRIADANGLKGLPHLLSVLKEFSGDAQEDVHGLITFGCLLASDERDTPLLLEVMSGMQFALTETIVRGIQAILVTGTLHQWIQAVARGCRQDQTTAVRMCFDKIYVCFCQQGLAALFTGTKHDLPDHTFYLTSDKRG